MKVNTSVLSIIIVIYILFLTILASFLTKEEVEIYGDIILMISTLSTIGIILLYVFKEEL